MTNEIIIESLAKDMLDLVDKVETEYGLEKGALMQAWIDEYNARKASNKKKEKKVYNH